MLTPTQAEDLKQAIKSLSDECSYVATLACSDATEPSLLKTAESVLTINKHRLNKMIDSLTLKRIDKETTK